MLHWSDVKVVSRESLLQKNVWRSSELDDLRVSVNVSWNPDVLVKQIDWIVRKMLEEATVELDFILIIEICLDDSLKNYFWSFQYLNVLKSTYTPFSFPVLTANFSRANFPSLNPFGRREKSGSIGVSIPLNKKSYAPLTK